LRCGKVRAILCLTTTFVLLCLQSRLYLRVRHPVPIHPHLCIPGEDDEGIRYQGGELRGGVSPGVADQAALKLITKYPQLLIVGTYHGYFDKTHGSQENELIVQAINRLDVDILLVGMGMPVQEKWLKENWPRLNCRVALPIGAAFDYLAGTTRRAPHWLTDHGFEWLGRLLVEPGRLWRRYVVGTDGKYV